MPDYTLEWRPAHAKRSQCSVKTTITATGPNEAEGFLRYDICQGTPIMILHRTPEEPTP